MENPNTPRTLGQTLGQIAFEAYNEKKGGLTYDGKPIPPWGSLSETAAGRAVQEAWEISAFAIYEETLRRLGAPGLIHQARLAIERTEIRSREFSLALTKLDEAAMWHAANPASLR